MARASNRLCPGERTPPDTAPVPHVLRALEWQLRPPALTPISARVETPDELRSAAAPTATQPSARHAKEAARWRAVARLQRTLRRLLVKERDHPMAAIVTSADPALRATLGAMDNELPLSQTDAVVSRYARALIAFRHSSPHPGARAGRPSPGAAPPLSRTGCDLVVARDGVVLWASGAATRMLFTPERCAAAAERADAGSNPGGGRAAGRRTRTRRQTRRPGAAANGQAPMPSLFAVVPGMERCFAELASAVFGSHGAARGVRGTAPHERAQHRGAAQGSSNTPGGGTPDDDALREGAQRRGGRASTARQPAPDGSRTDPRARAKSGNGADGESRRRDGGSSTSGGDGGSSDGGRAGSGAEGDVGGKPLFPSSRPPRSTAGPSPATEDESSSDRPAKPRRRERPAGARGDQSGRSSASHSSSASPSSGGAAAAAAAAVAVAAATAVTGPGSRHRVRGSVRRLSGRGDGDDDGDDNDNNEDDDGSSGDDAGAGELPPAKRARSLRIVRGPARISDMFRPQDATHAGPRAEHVRNGRSAFRASAQHAASTRLRHGVGAGVSPGSGAGDDRSGGENGGGGSVDGALRGGHQVWAGHDGMRPRTSPSPSPDSGAGHARSSSSADGELPARPAPGLARDASSRGRGAGSRSGGGRSGSGGSGGGSGAGSGARSGRSAGTEGTGSKAAAAASEATPALPPGRATERPKGRSSGKAVAGGTRAESPSSKESTPSAGQQDYPLRFLPRHVSALVRTPTLVLHVTASSVVGESTPSGSASSYQHLDAASESRDDTPPSLAALKTHVAFFVTARPAVEA